MKKLMLFSATIFIIIYLLLIWIIEETTYDDPTIYKTINTQYFSIEVPKNTLIKEVIDNDYNGYQAINRKPLAIWFKKFPLNQTPQYYLKNRLGKDKGKENISYQKIFPNNIQGTFYLVNKGRSFRRYYYQFTHKNIAIDLIHGANNTTLNTSKKILDHVIKSIHFFDGSNFFINQNWFNKIDDEIILQTQSKEQLYIIFGIVFIFIYFVLVLIFYASGRAQLILKEEKILFSESHVYFKLKKRFSINVNIGALYVTKHHLYLTLFKRVICKVKREQFNLIRTQEKKHLMIIFIELRKIIIKVEIQNKNSFLKVFQA